MALGTITDSGYTKTIVLLAPATATNSPPTVVTDGISLETFLTDGSMPRGRPITALLAIASTAGSATMTCTARLWGWHTVAGVWLPAGVGNGTTNGLVNGGNAIAESAADLIRHSELVTMAGYFQRLYLELTAIGGTATSVTAWLSVLQPYAQ